MCKAQPHRAIAQTGAAPSARAPPHPSERRSLRSQALVSKVQGDGRVAREVGRQGGGGEGGLGGGGGGGGSAPLRQRRCSRLDVSRRPQPTSSAVGARRLCARSAASAGASSLAAFGFGGASGPGRASPPPRRVCMLTGWTEIPRSRTSRPRAEHFCARSLVARQNKYIK